MQRTRSTVIPRYFVGSICATLVFLSTPCHSGCGENEMVAKRFDDAFHAFLSFCENPPGALAVSSNSYDFAKNDYFREINDLGVPALPHIVDKIAEHRDLAGECMLIAFRRITKNHNNRSREAILAWWQSGYRDTGSQFEKTYKHWSEEIQGEPTRWKDLADEKGNILTRDIAGDEELKAYRDFLSLGIAALPYAIEHLRNGETQLLDAIDYWTDNKPKEAFEKLEGEKMSKKDFYLAWWEENKDFWLLPQLKKPAESKE